MASSGPRTLPLRPARSVPWDPETSGLWLWLDKAPPGDPHFLGWNDLDEECRDALRGWSSNIHLYLLEYLQRLTRGGALSVWRSSPQGVSGVVLFLGKELNAQIEEEKKGISCTLNDQLRKWLKLRDWPGVAAALDTIRPLRNEVKHSVLLDLKLREFLEETLGPIPDPERESLLGDLIKFSSSPAADAGKWPVSTRLPPPEPHPIEDLRKLLKQGTKDAGNAEILHEGDLTPPCLQAFANAPAKVGRRVLELLADNVKDHLLEYLPTPAERSNHVMSMLHVRSC